MTVHVLPTTGELDAPSALLDRRVVESERRGRTLLSPLDVHGTSFAEGETRWRFSVDDVYRRVGAGIVAE